LLAAKRPISIRVKRMVTAAMEMMMAPLALLRMSGKNDFFF
jgi:hypothetical protein